MEIADATMNIASRDPQRVITRDNEDYTDTLLYSYYELSGVQGYNCPSSPLCELMTFPDDKTPHLPQSRVFT